MMPSHTPSNVTTVLVHGAWADGSSWNKVTTELQRRGFKVVATQLPLTSLSDDVTALRRVLRSQDAPVVLVGHSYGGAVITAAAAGDPKVKALVYVAAIVLDGGETVGEIFRRVAPHPKAPKLQPDDDGLLWVTSDAFRNAIAAGCIHGGNNTYGRDPETDRTQMSGRAHDSAGVEGEAVLVPDRGKRSHGLSRDAAVHRGKNEIQDHFAARRPFSLGFAP